MLNINVNGVEEKQDGEYTRPVPGGYKVKIVSVENDVQRQGLKIDYDFSDGEYKDYYKNLQERMNFWGGTMWVSYKEKALPFFKGFITSVEKSNDVKLIDDNGDIDEKKLIDLEVGVVLGEEEYKANDGTIKTRLHVVRKISTDRLEKGDFEVPEKKTLATTETTDAVDTTAFEQVESNLPF